MRTIRSKTGDAAFNTCKQKYNMAVIRETEDLGPAAVWKNNTLGKINVVLNVTYCTDLSSFFTVN